MSNFTKTVVLGGKTTVATFIFSTDTTFPFSRWLARLVAKCCYRVMSQPMKISDELILDARLIAEIAERSIAGQIEF
jgi:hypothetical protein